jgi:hypothetical protein
MPLTPEAAGGSGRLTRRHSMVDGIKRLIIGGVVAFVLGATLGGGPAAEPASAKESKPVKFDISVSQFKRDCEEAGGWFNELPGGRYVCSFDGWEIECSKATGTCRIYCDPKVKCVSSKQRPRNVAAAINLAARVVNEPEQKVEEETSSGESPATMPGTQPARDAPRENA